MTASPGRARRLRSGTAGRPAPEGGPAPVLVMLLMVELTIRRVSSR